MLTTVSSVPLWLTAAQYYTESADRQILHEGQISEPRWHNTARYFQICLSEVFG